MKLGSWNQLSKITEDYDVDLMRLNAVNDMMNSMVKTKHRDEGNRAVVHRRRNEAQGEDTRINE